MNQLWLYMDLAESVNQNSLVNIVSGMAHRIIKIMLFGSMEKIKIVWQEDFINVAERIKLEINR